jgi:hypothetical protein
LARLDFNKRVGSSGDVGIWHETYLVPAGAYERIYNNMPPTSLSTVATLVPAAGRKATAASRAGLRDEAYPDGARTERIEAERSPLGMPAGGRGDFMGLRFARCERLRLVPARCRSGRQQ